MRVVRLSVSTRLRRNRSNLFEVARRRVQPDAAVSAAEPGPVRVREPPSLPGEEAPASGLYHHWQVWRFQEAQASGRRPNALAEDRQDGVVICVEACDRERSRSLIPVDDGPVLKAEPNQAQRGG